jgi:hypothetical protein
MTPHFSDLVVINDLPNMPPSTRRRRSRRTVLKSKPFQAPPFWLTVDEPKAPVQKSPILMSQPFEGPPFYFRDAPPRRRRGPSWPVRFTRFAVPPLIALLCAGSIALLAIQRMRPPQSNAVCERLEPGPTGPTQVASAHPITELPPPRKPSSPEINRPAQREVAQVAPEDVAVPQVSLIKPTEQAGVAKSTPVVQAIVADGRVEGPVAQDQTEEVVAAACEPGAVEPPKSPPAIAKQEPAHAPAVCESCKEGGAKSAGYGTNVTFVDSTQKAYEQAKSEKKLVFLMTISGNFEDPAFT